MYSYDIINLAIMMFNQDKLQLKDICAYLRISRQVLYFWMNKFRANFDENFPLKKEDFVPKIKNTKSRLFVTPIIDFVKKNPGCSLSDIQNNISKNKISNATICNILKKNKISHKKINNRILGKTYEEIEEQRITFAKNVDYNINDVLFLDESSFCVNDHKRYGYGEKGKEIKKNIKHKKNKETSSVIAIMSNSGIVCKEIVKGTINKDVYTNFLNKNKALLENKILIQDNARIHHALTVKEYAKNNNINLKYNPAYSPEFNPIELVFNKVKSAFRKLDHKNLIADIDNSFNTITSDNCQKFYDYVSKNYINKYSQ